MTTLLRLEVERYGLCGILQPASRVSDRSSVATHEHRTWLSSAVQSSDDY